MDPLKWIEHGIQDQTASPIIWKLRIRTTKAVHPDIQGRNWLSRGSKDEAIAFRSLREQNAEQRIIPHGSLRPTLKAVLHSPYVRLHESTINL